jgi:hypothetical protein
LRPIRARSRKLPAAKLRIDLRYPNGFTVREVESRYAHEQANRQYNLIVGSTSDLQDRRDVAEIRPEAALDVTRLRKPSLRAG